MNRYKRLIDDRGCLWDTADGSLARFLGASLPPDKLIDYAVVNLGFVEIGRLNRALFVRCRPSLITGPAIAAATYVLHDEPALTVVLRTLGDCWQDLILRKRSDFVQLLGAFAEQQQGTKFWTGTRHMSGSKASNASGISVHCQDCHDPGSE